MTETFEDTERDIVIRNAVADCIVVDRKRNTWWLASDKLMDVYNQYSEEEDEYTENPDDPDMYRWAYAVLGHCLSIQQAEDLRNNTQP